MWRDVADYLRALWRHGGAFLSGTLVTLSLGIVPAILGWVAPRWAWVAAIVVGLLVAGFSAWREEHRIAIAVRATTPSINFVAPPKPVDGTRFLLPVHYVNPGPATSFNKDWRLDVTLADETVVAGLPGHIGAQWDGPLPQGMQRTIEIEFPFRDAITNLATLEGATYSLTVSDINGRQLRAKYPPLPQG
jgi:hypothetical protein